MEPIGTGGIGRRAFAGWLCGGGFATPFASLARTAEAPQLLLAREASTGVDPAGHLVSEKLDGVRAFWDGERLRLRSGLPAAAPRWFIDRLPPRPLDGELWLGRGRFEPLAGAVRRALPIDAEWREIRYMVFELPQGEGSFRERHATLQALVAQRRWPQLQAVAQRPVADRAALKRWLDEVLRAGGEGLMLHRADAPYTTGRSEVLLKLKPLHDGDAVVIGHRPGSGRHAGRLGALQVETDDGLRFLIGTGFSDAQRASPPAVGSRISFTHRGWTGHGVPRFASFLRVRTVD